MLLTKIEGKGNRIMTTLTNIYDFIPVGSSLPALMSFLAKTLGTSFRDNRLIGPFERVVVETALQSYQLQNSKHSLIAE